MVGKGEIKSSRIFQQCYAKCCKLQNLTPLNNVIPSGNGKVLDFCVDRIKYADWPPILNALSCDLSLHSVAIRCRQQVKTVLEHIDCERLAKTVNKRAVILTNFMLSNVVEALAQLLSNTTLLNSLLLEGLPLKVPYLNPLNEAILGNSSLQHLYLPRCLLGDAGCLALCKSVRCLPNILTLDLSGCELTLLGASYIADLIKYQKIHRYSENWVHTLRYRLPELDAMAGLRRITLCGNSALGDAGVGKLLEVLADDLWIKALDVQNCGLTEVTANNAFQMLNSNTTLCILDLRYNPEVSSESLSSLRVLLRRNERPEGQLPWLNNVGSSERLKSVSNKNGMVRDRVASNTRSAPIKYANKTTGVKKEKDYAEELTEQLQEEISHRRQLEELNLQLVKQMKELKQQQIRMWANQTASSGSEQSFQASSRSYNMSSSSGSSSVPIDQNTLSYIQQAFKDIYTFIKNNQCHGQCLQEEAADKSEKDDIDKIEEEPEVRSEIEYNESSDLRINIVPKKAKSTHVKIVEKVKLQKITKSAHMLIDSPRVRDSSRDGDNHMMQKPQVIERHMGDTKNTYAEDQSLLEDIMGGQMKNKRITPNSPVSSGSSIADDSSATLVCSPHSSSRTPGSVLNPREALYSSSEDEDSN